MQWRVDMDGLQELVRLHRMGTGDREVARLLGMSPNTERQYRRALATAGLLAGAVEELPALEVLKAAVEERLPRKLPVQQTSSLEGWLGRIDELWKQGLGPRAVYDRLRLEEEGFRHVGPPSACWVRRPAPRRHDDTPPDRPPARNPVCSSLDQEPGPPLKTPEAVDEHHGDAKSPR